ncbi:MAG: TetR/AcrR family transcriptional regulator [Solirubrobacterales bacterium]
MVTTREDPAAVELKREAARPAGRRLPAAERRALIERAAARLFAERGYETTTVEDICAAAGVSKPMLYRHFESKRDLCMRLMERRRDELAAAPLGTFLETEGAIEQRLEAMIDAWFAHVAEHPYGSRVLFQDITGDAELRELQRELRRRQRAADVAMLREFGPPLPETELEPLGEIIRSSLTGLALWWLAQTDVPRAAVVAAMLRTMRGMLGT